MKKLITALFVVSILILCLPTQTVSYQAPIKPPTTQELIKQYSAQYGVSSVTMDRIIACESNYNPNAIHKNDGGKGKHSVGIMQFQHSTFLTWEAKLGEDLDYYSYNDQIKLGAYMLSKGQIRQWTCGRKLLTA